MRLFRSPVLLRYALWIALLSGLLGLWAHHWRANLVNNYSWSPSNYAAANNLMHICWESPCWRSPAWASAWSPGWRPIRPSEQLALPRCPIQFRGTVSEQNPAHRMGTHIGTAAHECGR